MPRPFKLTTQMPPRNNYLRIIDCIIGQKSKTYLCPNAPSLLDDNTLVTGGTNGIGAEIVNGFELRGAKVYSAARGSNGTPDSHTFLRMDLSDLSSIKVAVADLHTRIEGRPLSIVCFNAGISAHSYSQSADGYEKTYAVNCLGHHYLFKLLHDHGLLADGASIVFTTGDIYCLADDCTAEFEFKGKGRRAYCRSKLGNLWQVHELSKNYPQYKITAVHPGVVASNLEGPLTGMQGFIMKALLIPTHQGAQSSLISATQPNILSGSYFHNMRGLVELREGDPALDRVKSAAFVNQLDSKIEEFENQT